MNESIKNRGGSGGQEVVKGLAKGMTLGLDLGDRTSNYCLLGAEGEVVEEGKVLNTEEALGEVASGWKTLCLRIAKDDQV